MKKLFFLGGPLDMKAERIPDERPTLYLVRDKDNRIHEYSIQRPKKNNLWVGFYLGVRK